MKTNPNELNGDPQKKRKVFGDPEYSANEDIYSREEKESFNEEVLPDQVGKESNVSLDEGLDVPGTDLDDADEIVGEEDEENNYYSLGGDDHNNLDEDEGE